MALALASTAPEPKEIPQISHMEEEQQQDADGSNTKAALDGQAGTDEYVLGPSLSPLCPGPMELTSE